MFSGLFWSGEQAKELGLIDGFGNLDYVAREVIGEESIVDYSYRPDFWEQFAQDVGVSMAAKITSIFGANFELK